MTDKVVPARIKPVAGQAPVPSVQAFAALSEVVTATREYVLLVQEERTKRAEIGAAEHVQVERIRAAEVTLRLYFERVFAERRQNNDAMFARLDQALESGDPQMVHAVVRGIVELAQTSPLAGLPEFSTFWAELGTADNPVEI